MLPLFRRRVLLDTAVDRGGEAHSSVEDEGEEEEEEEEDLTPICDAMMTSHVLCQIPFLLKVAEQWMNRMFVAHSPAGAVPSTNSTYAEKLEAKSFNSLAVTALTKIRTKEGGEEASSPPQRLLAEWWRALFALEAAGRCPMIGIARLSALPASSINLLDDSILGETGRVLDALMVLGLGYEASLPLTIVGRDCDEGQSRSVSSDSHENGNDENENGSVGLAYSPEELHININQSAAAGAGAGAGVGVLPTTTTSSQYPNRSKGLKLILRRPTTTTTSSSVSTTLQAAVTESTSTSTDSTGAGAEEAGAGRYGTRGLRLSSTFLRRATDIDISVAADSYGNDNRREAALEDGEDEFDYEGRVDDAIEGGSYQSEEEEEEDDEQQQRGFKITGVAKRKGDSELRKKEGLEPHKKAKPSNDSTPRLSSTTSKPKPSGRDLVMKKLGLKAR